MVSYDYEYKIGSNRQEIACVIFKNIWQSRLLLKPSTRKLIKYIDN